MFNPKVSVIVPVYNVEKYINRCIDSILSQTFTDFECILVDDCTPDNSGKICDEYALQDHRIKVIHKPVNEGLPQARKTGFEHSSGDYISNVDSDDYIENNMFEKMYSKASSEDLDFLYCDFYIHDKNDKIDYIVPLKHKDNFVDNVKIFVLNIESKSYLWNKIVKRSVYEKINFPIYGCFEDKCILAQIVFFSNKLNYLNESFYHYIYNSSSIINNKKKRLNNFNEQKININNVILFLKSNYNENLDEFEPELSIRMNWLKKNDPSSLFNNFRRNIKKIIPQKLLNFLKSFKYY